MVRATKQRKAILDSLLHCGRPLSVSEILESAKNSVKGLGIATVYRNLKALQEDGSIKKVDLPGQLPRWEMVPEEHHHHFLCRTCDKLFEVHACPENIAALLPDGYILETHDILLQGQCDTCAGFRRTRSGPAKKHK
ncbi:MAG TPA: transcriptional repressor [Dehalococcoidales bacterium]|nr:transcriptional repressor [Dehalococcoidales bacterium]